MNKKIEDRLSTIRSETRSADDGKKTLIGYAAVFNSDTTIGDYFVERIDPGAFDKTIKGDIRALINHDTGRLIGRTKSGTLKLSVDSKGLAVEINPPDTTDGRDIVTLVERGDLDGMSIGFIVTRQEWDDTGNIPVRTILEADLLEVSAVAFPAYTETQLSARSLDAAKAEIEALRANADAKKEAEEKIKRENENNWRKRKEADERKARTENAIRGIR